LGTDLPHSGPAAEGASPARFLAPAQKAPHLLETVSVLEEEAEVLPGAEEQEVVVEPPVAPAL